MRARCITFLRAPTGLLSLFGASFWLTLAIIGPLIWGRQATQLDSLAANHGPTAHHWLGTDTLGRDVLARTLSATRLSLELDILAIGSAAVIGFTIGLAIANAGRIAQAITGMAIDTFLSFGDILLAIVVISIVGIGARGAVIAVAISFAPAFARLGFNMSRTIAEQEYVAAARVIGVPRRLLLTRYILPNVADGLVVSFLTALGLGLLAISSLSFLGLGVQAPQYDWGQLLTSGIQEVYTNPSAALAPATTIAAAGLAFSLLGDALARALNPLVWTRGRAKTLRHGETASRSVSPGSFVRDPTVGALHFEPPHD